jgi:SAM-dependent methyltransferase
VLIPNSRSLHNNGDRPKNSIRVRRHGYASYDQLPLAKLEAELVAKAIGDCAGLTVLDLGGGEGQYARKAIELGAELVDVLDISPAMLALGIEAEAKIGREGKIRWFEADATKALDRVPLIPGGYDVVMCNWLFDHATTGEASLWYITALHPHLRKKRRLTTDKGSTNLHGHRNSKACGETPPSN